MSTTLRRMQLREALAIAETVLDRLRPVIARGVIVGSLRRERPDVGDIELLVEPIATPTLFGEPDSDSDAIRRRVELDVGHVRMGGSRHLRAALYDEPAIAVEIFIRRAPAAWGSLLAIRTGPAELGAVAMRRLRDRGYVHIDGHVIVESTRATVPTETEEQFFALADLPCVLPNRRDRLATNYAPIRR